MSDAGRPIGGRRTRPTPILWVAAVALLAIAAGNAATYLLAIRLGQLWPFYLRGGRPAGIVIHHSDTPSPGAAAQLLDAVERSHASRGWGVYFSGRVYHVGYHYLVLPDGRVLRGRPDWMPGAHTRGHNDMLGVCVVGSFTADSRGFLRRPSRAQMDALTRLVRELLARYHLRPARVYLHSDLGPTRCPGEGFPRAEFLESLRRPWP